MGGDPPLCFKELGMRNGRGAERGQGVSDTGTGHSKGTQQRQVGNTGKGIEVGSGTQDKMLGDRTDCWRTGGLSIAWFGSRTWEQAQESWWTWESNAQSGVRGPRETGIELGDPGSLKVVM